MPVAFITVLIVAFRQKSIYFHIDKKFRFCDISFFMVHKIFFESKRTESANIQLWYILD